MIKRRFREFRASKRGAVFLGTLGVFGVTTLAMAVGIIISNLLSLGSAQLLAQGVQLTEVTPLSGPIYPNNPQRVRFNIENTRFGVWRLDVFVGFCGAL